MKTGKVLAIIQARMSSTRLPGKVLLPIVDGKGALELMLERVCRAKTLHKIVVATTTSSCDDRIADLCEHLGYEYFRGSEEDVLDRYYQTALAFGPGRIIVRLTGDCPLHDPQVIDKVVESFVNSDADYASNIEPPTYPDGLDVEIFTFEALRKAWRNAKLSSEREHVTIYIRNHPELFSKKNVSYSKDCSKYRWTLDEESDYRLIKKIFTHFYHRNPCFTMQDILSFIKENPDIESINSGIQRNEGFLEA